LQLAFSSNVSIETYLALTSNTLQTGARVNAYFSANGVEISGYLGFDALVQFEPLYYVVDVAAGFALKYGGFSFANVTFSGFLEGPNPHRIKGSATCSTFLGDIHEDVDVQFGEKEPEGTTPLIDPWPSLELALKQDGSWSTDFPEWANLGVTIRESSKEINLVHPMGTVKVSQKITPLNYTLSKFGAGCPINNFKFVMGSSKMKTVSTTQEQFAPAQFADYDNEQKLSLKPYQLMDSGLVLGLEVKDAFIDSKSASHKSMEYDTIIIRNMGKHDEELTLSLFSPSASHTRTFELVGAAYQTVLKNDSRLRYNSGHNDEDGKVSFTVEKFFIVDQDLNIVTDKEFLDNEGKAQKFSQAMAMNKLQDFKKANPFDKRNLQVISAFELQEAVV
jgi:hypothetical protein